MRFHRNAKLGLAGRRELVLAIVSGCSIRQTAATFNVSPATAHRWWRRWRAASETERRSLSCLLDRSSRPTRSPRRLAPELEQAICECRRKTGWGPRLVAGATGVAHSTVWKVLRRFGLSRPARPPREPANRYEWPCPGDLLHMDVSRFARFLRPGHRVTGDRSQRSRTWMRPETRVATTSCTRSSTTTPASPTLRSTPTSGRRPAPPSWSVRSPSSPGTASRRSE
jgi:transposase